MPFATKPTEIRLVYEMETMDDHKDSLTAQTSFRTLPRNQWRENTRNEEKLKARLKRDNGDVIPVVVQDRERLASKAADEQYASGNNHERIHVKEGEQFVRITAQDDRGTSPYFTKESELKDISCRDRNGRLHLNEDAYRERFSIPSSSRLEKCEIYTAKKNFVADRSEVAPSTENFGHTNHNGGGTQYLIVNREENLGRHPDLVRGVKCYDNRRFEDVQTVMREARISRREMNESQKAEIKYEEARTW